MNDIQALFKPPAKNNYKDLQSEANYDLNNGSETTVSEKAAEEETAPQEQNDTIKDKIKKESVIGSIDSRYFF